MDVIKVFTDKQWNVSKPLERLALASYNSRGITESNWRTWFVDHPTYVDLLKYNQSGILWRYHGLLDNNRVFKVLGMILLGLYFGRKLMYRKL
ncbi:MAG: hypothetical protein ABIO60_06790 [Aquaticitalea sp.]